MIQYKHCFTLITILLLSQAIFAQDKDVPAVRELMHQLNEAYNQFDSEKSAQLLNLAFKSIDKFSAEDQIQIYKIAGFVAFQNGNSTLAANHFWSLLNINPTYSLDPVTTPPKLITLFQKTKIEYLEDMTQRMHQLQTSAKPIISWRAVLFPGWEQWHRGYKTKGMVLSSLGLVNLGGFIYSVIQTRMNRDNYRNAEQPELVQSYYSDYNASYKRQYYFAYGLAAMWAFSQVDLLLWSKPEIRMSPSLTYFDPDLNQNLSLGLTFSVIF